MDIKVHLSLQQINYLLSVLFKRPYEEVKELIALIRQQAEVQIKDKEEEMKDSMPKQDGSQPKKGKSCLPSKN